MMILKWEAGSGNQIEFTDKNKYIINNWAGLGYPPNQIKTTKSPDQIGNTIIGQLLKPRSIEIEFTVITDNKDQLYQLKEEVVEAFNPVSSSGRLTYIDPNGNVYQIKAVTAQIKSIDQNEVTFQNYRLKLKAPDPRWYDPTEQNVTLNQLNEITNSGDTDTPVKITLEGPMSSPVIRNTTAGKSIKLNYTIRSGEKVEINTEFGNKSIDLIDSLGRKRRAFSLLSFDSQLFKLIKGSNFIEFKASNLDLNSSAVISYKERYLEIQINWE